MRSYSFIGVHLVPVNQPNPIPPTHASANLNPSSLCARAGRAADLRITLLTAAMAAAVAGEVPPQQWRGELGEVGVFRIGQVIAAAREGQIRTLQHPL